MTTQPSDRIRLASWPTPLEPAPRLAEALGLGPDDLWIKRDDLTGLAGGGNKIRKLEWTVAAAIAAGADALVTTGAPQSNHARLTAAAGARLGLRVVLVFPGDPGGTQSGNLALDGLLGARIAWAGDVGLAEAADAVVAQLRAQGGRPALIPFGGSSGVGARGYVACARELQQQLPDLDTVVVALGSGGTMAGLVAALGPDKVLAHRLALAEKLGRPLLPRMFALHRCDNPPCVNPAHLYEGTHVQNMADMRGKHAGEKHNKARLSDAQVTEIRSSLGVLSRGEVAAKFGISVWYADQLRSGRRRAVA